MLISIPPKHSVAQIIGYMKGKSSISTARNVERKVRNFLRHKFWARGPADISSVGIMIRAHLKSRTGRPAFGSASAEDLSRPKIQSIVLTSVKTAFGGSQSNLQLCWRLLAFSKFSERTRGNNECSPPKGVLQEYLDAKARDAEAELRFDEAWRTFEELAERLGDDRAYEVTGMPLADRQKLAAYAAARDARKRLFQYARTLDIVQRIMVIGAAMCADLPEPAND